MKQIIGLRFSRYGQAFAFACDEGDQPLSVGEFAMARTDQGLNCGIVLWQRPWIEDVEALLMERNRASSISGAEAGEAISLEARRASEKEASAAKGNLELADRAFALCRSCIENRRLDMKLIDVEVLHDRAKIIFYFTAPTRIDFRELVKDLVHEYHTRIELRQIGVRHETQMLGALGNCGMTCCCKRFLHKFAPVTIKMAKEQNLFLNPAKISGVCGRLLCCLSYEQDNYDAFQRSCPKLGKRYKTDKGFLRILRCNMFRNTVAALSDDGQETEMQLDEWLALNPSRAETPPAASDAAPPRATAEEMMIISASPDTLDDDLAGLEDVEEDNSLSRLPKMLGSEEEEHHRKKHRRERIKTRPADDRRKPHR